VPIMYTILNKDAPNAGGAPAATHG